VENNYLSDKDITTFTEKYAAAKTDAEKEQLVAELKKLDADKQKQALSTGISIADQKTELEKLKQLAASPDCTGQCRELANYSISQLEPVVNDTHLHKDNLTKAVLASTIIALTLEQSDKSGGKAPAAETSNASKSTSAIDDIVKQDTAQYFGQDRKYWSSEPIQFNGNKVYQRDDLFDPKYVDPKSGKTNLELMQAGRAPIGKDGKSINLHHMLQKQDGPIAEVTQSFHKDNHSVIHINDNSIPSGINRSEFNKWRSDYWKQRANDFK
jgi:hypothetical protein